MGPGNSDCVWAGRSAQTHWAGHAHSMARENGITRSHESIRLSNDV